MYEKYNLKQRQARNQGFTLNLIPWPQRIGIKAAADAEDEAGQANHGCRPIDRSQAYLAMNHADDRLVRCARGMFLRVLVCEDGKSGEAKYILSSQEPQASCGDAAARAGTSERWYTDTSECRSADVSKCQVLEEPTCMSANTFDLLGPNGLADSENEKPEWETRAGGYLLAVAKGSFRLVSHSPEGLFYGMQTIRQLFTHGGIPDLNIEDWPDIALRGDYLDLRNIFPPFEHILRFVRELAEYKINTLVIEYEDKLPFEQMKFLRHETDCFTPDQLSELLQTAKENFIDIIPLQQSFGHLEYALKFPQYQYLRETRDNPGEMCPLREGAKELATALLEDTARLHPDSKYLHIGCDEVWSLGQSEECRASGKSMERIFIEFVNQLIDRVCALGKIPIIWHDMFAHADLEELRLLDKRAVVAVWLYSGSDMPYRAKKLIDTLTGEGISCLGASSVRCWDNKPDQNYPVIENRLQNLDLWAGIIKAEKLEGIIHTNWASSFSFGRPYGLFETSRYPLFYAADVSWGLREENDGFLSRFLHLYHGMDGEGFADQGFENKDYYRILHDCWEEAKKNQDTARLIALMVDLENSLPVWHTMFRCEMFPDSEVEYACLKERTRVAVEQFYRVEAQLKEFIPRLLSPSMGELYLESRVYLYHRAIEGLEGILKRYEDRTK